MGKTELKFFEDSPFITENVPDPLLSGAKPIGRKYDLSKLSLELDYARLSMEKISKNRPSRQRRKLHDLLKTLFFFRNWVKA